MGRRLDLHRDDHHGPAEAPRPAAVGPAAAAVALVRLPTDLVVALGYLVRELPPLVQDLRSAVNDVARLAHAGEPGALGGVLEGLSRAAATDGELTALLRAGADACRAYADEAAEPDTDG